MVPKTEVVQTCHKLGRTFMLVGASEVISFCIRSAIPGNMVVPPERMMLPKRSRRMSMSHFWIELYLDVIGR